MGAFKLFGDMLGWARRRAVRARWTVRKAKGRKLRMMMSMWVCDECLLALLCLREHRR